MISKQYLKYIDEISAPTIIQGNLEWHLQGIRLDWNNLAIHYKTHNRQEIADLLWILAANSLCALSILLDKDRSTLASEMEQLHRTKNAGYVGDNPDSWANFRLVEQFGISTSDGLIARLSDKYSRFWIVYKDSSKDKVGESAIDTLKDFTAYCLILLCVLEEKGTK